MVIRDRCLLFLVLYTTEENADNLRASTEQQVAQKMCVFA